MKKLPEHVIASSEAAESSCNVKDPEEEKHDGVVLFEGPRMEVMKSIRSCFVLWGIGLM